MNLHILLDLSLITILLLVAIAIIRMRSLFAVVMLQGVYSLVSAAWFVSLDAVDVAFTEAAVGAGVSTVLMLSAMLLADRQSSEISLRRQIAPIFIVICTGIALFYAIGDLPLYGDSNSPANSGAGRDYLSRTYDDIHIPNVVTAVLASYRGFDTFGEVVVIFAAGLGVLLLLGLNGNAGMWRAKPNGVRIGRALAPAARRRKEKNMSEGLVKATANEESAKKTSTKTTTVKKAATKKTTAKKVTTKKATTKKSSTVKSKKKAEKK